MSRNFDYQSIIRNTALRCGIYGSFALLILVVLAPFYWLLKSSLSTPEDLYQVPPRWLPTPTLANFASLIDEQSLGSLTLNSLIFAGGSALCVVAISFIAAYGFAQLDFPGKRVVLWILVMSMALPEIATILPLYRMLLVTGLYDTLTGLVLIMSSVLAPFTVWVFVPFIQQVPRAIEEAARIDGAGLPTILWRVYVPSCGPALLTMLVINFVNSWNNLLYPLAFSSENARCLSMVITSLHDEDSAWGIPWQKVSALGILMVVPSILLVLCAQRGIVRGLTSGAVK